ncbi:MAG: hypothetical protein JO004_03645 [Methylobacteriaceae bacterium]|nr:hypothetical protein [Methylobacteriaceae bacterium]
MSHNDHTTLTGTVTDIFAHRFVVKTSAGNVLADLTPHGARQVQLREGDTVVLSGERKPSEVKVSRITCNGHTAISIEHKGEHKHVGADPKRAVHAARKNGFAVIGAPRRKPKHFEVLGRDEGGDFVELHIELDGEIRKTRPIEKRDPKWADELNAAL